MSRAEGQQGQQVHRPRQGKHRLGVPHQPGHRRAERQARADRGDRAEPADDHDRSRRQSAYVTATPIWQYSINPATGKLTPKSPAMVAGGGGPHDLAVAPDGKNLYVVNVASATIAQYAISPATGALSARPVSTARHRAGPEAIALSPDGKNAYVTSEHEGALSQFAICPVTGKIIPLSPARHRAVPRLTRRSGHPLTRAWPRTRQPGILLL